MNLPTETLTRYVQRDAHGRVVAVLNEQAAEQLGGEIEALTVPTEEAVQQVLASIPETAGATRSPDLMCWRVNPAMRDARSSLHPAHVADRIHRATGWRVSNGGSKEAVFVWPTAHVAERGIQS